MRKSDRLVCHRLSSPIHLDLTFAGEVTVAYVTFARSLHPKRGVSLVGDHLHINTYELSDTPINFLACDAWSLASFYVHWVTIRWTLMMAGYTVIKDLLGVS